MAKQATKSKLSASNRPAAAAARITAGRLRAPRVAAVPATTTISGVGTDALHALNAVGPPPPEIAKSLHHDRLRDVAIATFGRPGPQPEIVVGTDDRTKVIASNFPWSAVASLVIVGPDNVTWSGTAWAVGPRTLITAGHVVYLRPNPPGQPGWAKRILVAPARDGTTCPFGAPTAVRFNAHRSWIDNGDPDFDVGAIFLENPLPAGVGALGFGVFTDTELESSDVTVSGYPGDKDVGTQWADTKNVSSVDQFKIYYEVDTAGGESGAPIIRFVENLPYAAGVHAYGWDTNFGVRINSEIYDMIQEWESAS